MAPATLFIKPFVKILSSIEIKTKNASRNETNLQCLESTYALLIKTSFDALTGWVTNPDPSEFSFLTFPLNAVSTNRVICLDLVISPRNVSDLVNNITWHRNADLLTVQVLHISHTVVNK